MAEGYDVGSVYLQVIPSYRGFIDSIREQARGARQVFADEFSKGTEIQRGVEKAFGKVDASKAGEKAADSYAKGFTKGLQGKGVGGLIPDTSREANAAGEKAGKSYSGAFERALKSGVSGALRDLPAIDVKINDREAKREIESIRSSLERLNGRRIGVDISAEQALRGLEQLRARLAALRDKNLNIDANFDFEAAQAKLDAFMDGLKRDGVKIPVDAELGAGARQVHAKLKALLSDIGPVKIDANSTEAERKVAALRAKIADAEFRVRIGETGATEATREIEALIAEMEILRAMPDIHKDIKFDLDRGLANFKGAGAEVDDLDAKIRKFGNSLRDNGASFRIFNFGVLAIASLLPALIPLLATATGAALGLGSAFVVAASGVGVLGLAFRGIGGALQAYQAQDKQAATQASTSARAQQSAARSIRDAQQGVQRAREDAARSAEDSAKRIASADQGVVRAQESAARQAKASARAIADAQQGAADAVQNLARVQAQAARDTAQSARRVADAERAAADARVAAQKSIQQATRNVETAERSLAAAQKSSLRAQQDLNQAREDAKRNLEDMNNALASGAIREQQAILDVQEAALALNAVLEDPQSTVREKKAAQLAYDAQVQSLKELRLQNQRLTEDTAKANAAGVEGSDQVTAARDKIADAATAEADAQRALTQAREDSAQAQVDAARRVADADQSVADARESQALQAENSARAIADAQDKIVDANQRVIDAQEAAAQSAQDSARSIADAQASASEARESAARAAADSAQSIADAEQRLADANTQAADSLNQANAAANNLAYALSQLSPAGRDFVNFLRGELLPYVQQLQFAAQQGFLPGFTDGIQILLGQYGPGLLKFVGDVAEKLGELSVKAANLLISPTFQDFFATVAKYAPTILDSLGKIAGGLSTAFAILFTAFAPLGDQFLAFLGNMAYQFAALMQSFVDSAAFQQFLAYLQQQGPLLGALFVALVEAALNLAVAMAPVATVLIQALTAALNFIAGLDPKTLGTIVTVVLALVVGIQLMSGFMIVLGTALSGAIPFLLGLSGVAEALGPVLILAGAAVAALVGAIIALVANGGGVSNFFEPLIRYAKEVWANIKEVAGAFVEGLLPALGDVSGVFEGMGPDFKRVGDVIVTALTFISDYVAGIFAPAFKIAGVLIGLAINTIITIVTALVAAVNGDWGKVRDILLNYGQSILDGLKEIFSALYDFLLAIIGQTRDGVGKSFSEMWKNVVDFAKKIYDGVIGWFTNLYDELVGHSIVPDMVKAVLDWFLNLWNKTVEYVKGLRDGVVNWFQNLWDTAVDRTAKMVIAILTAYYNFKNDATRTINEMVTAVIKFFTDLRDDATKRGDELRANVYNAFVTLYNTTIGPNGLIVRFAAGALKFFTDLRDNITRTINELPGKFTAVVDAIGTAWDKIRDKTKEPIRFIVNTVLNNGLLAGYNSIAKTFTGTDPGLKINLPQGFAVGGWTGPGSKYQPAGVVHADEFVIRKESQQRLSRENPGLLDYMNRFGRMPGYANGGIVNFGHLIQKQFGALVSEHPAFGGVSPVHAGRGHYEGRAIDVNTRPGTSALEQRELAPIVALAKQQGFYTIFMAPGHYNHAHIEDRGGVSGAIDDIGAAIGNAAAAARDAALGLVNGLGIDLSGFNFSGPFADVVKAVPGKLLEMAKAKLFDMASTVGDLLSPGSATDVPAGGAGAAGSNKEIVRSIANGYGWGAGAQWDALVALVNSESGFRNTAQNPTSTAYGMFQFLNGTWAGLGATKTSDPRLQAIAGLKYVSQRYGDPVKAWAFHRARGYYADGGLVGAGGGMATEAPTAPTLYDTGGMVPPGLTTILNATGKPEAMLPPALVDAILSGSTGKQGATVVTHMDGTFYSYDPTELAAEAERRRADRVAVAGLSNLAKGL